MRHLFFIILLIVSIVGSTPAQDIDQDPRKVASVNSDSFLHEGPSGIPRLINAFQAGDQTKALNAQITDLTGRIKSLKERMGNVPCSVELLYVLESYQRDLRLLREQRSAFYETLKYELMDKLQIYAALQEFRKRRGYTVIIDRSAISQKAIVYAGYDSFKNVTQEFVSYYNTGYSRNLPAALTSSK